MKKIGLSILLGLLVLPLALMAQPKLDFEGGRVFDWGDVKPKDSPLKAKITLYNTGTELLKITKVTPGCGCTTSKLDKDEVLPGDSTFIELTLNIKDKAGKLTKSVTFTTNVPGTEKYVYMLKCNIITGYRLNPQNLNFFNCEQGKEAISKLTLENTSKTDLLIDSLIVEPNFMTANLTKGQIIKPGEIYTIECKAVPKKTENFYPRIMMKFKGNPDLNDLTIYGSGRAKISDTEINANKPADETIPQLDRPKPPVDPNMPKQLPPKPTELPKAKDPSKTEVPQAPVVQKPIKK